MTPKLPPSKYLSAKLASRLHKNQKHLAEPVSISSSDVLVGGSGADIFVFTHSDSDYDTILDFTHLDHANLATQENSPPPFGEFLLAIMGGRRRDKLIGDFDERFKADLNSYGYARAARMYWAGILGSVAPLVWTRLKRAGFWALFVATIRHFVGG